MIPDRAQPPAPLSPGLCDCPWPEDDLAPEQPCGCGQEAVRLYRDTVWHWNGQHWRGACLIGAVQAQLADLTAQFHEIADAVYAASGMRSNHLPSDVGSLIHDWKQLRAQCQAQAEELKEARETLANEAYNHEATRNE